MKRKASAELHVRCCPSDKTAWQAASARAGMTLAKWIIARLNSAMKK